MKMASSPTPSLDSIRGTNSIESYGEHNGYLSDSPLTLSGSSPPVSDSAICDEFQTSSSTGSTGSSASSKQHHTISASVSSSPSASSSSSASSTSSSSGLSGCGSSSSNSSASAVASVNCINTNGSSNNNTTHGTNGPGVIGSGKGSPSNVLAVSTAPGSSAAPRCTACKSKQSDAVAKCYECVSFLCANCVTAHQFMHCFNGHNVCLIKSYETSTVAQPINNSNNNNNSNNSHNAGNDYKLSSSLTMMLQQHQQLQKQQPLSQLSKIVLNSHAASTAAAAAAAASAVYGETHVAVAHQQQQQEPLSVELFPPLMGGSRLYCQRHKHELLKFSCRTCCTLVCQECVVLEHASGLHEVEHVPMLGGGTAGIATVHPGAAGQHTTPEAVVQNVVDELRAKAADIAAHVAVAEPHAGKYKMQYQKAHNELSETYQFFCSMLDERKQELLKELESLYSAKLSAHNSWTSRSKEISDKVLQTCDAIERSQKPHNVADVLLLRKTLEQQLQAALQELQLPYELEFMSNYQSIQAGVRNTFGYVRASNSEGGNIGGKQPPIARPTQSSSNGSSSGVAASQLPSGLGLAANLLESGAYGAGNQNGGANNALLARSSQQLLLQGNGGNGSSGAFDELLPKSYQSVGTTVPYVSVNPYEKWSNGGSDSLFAGNDAYASAQLLNTLAGNSGGTSVTNGASANSLSISAATNDSLLDLTSKLLSASIYPPKSQIKRQKMIYHCKFGEFGVMEGQFTEPSGVAVNAQNDIIVADTNNHRIQIFDKEGRFKFQFGECGKRDSQLLYPNRVAVVRTSGDIIVTERSPTHQIQIYNQYGQFVRKFGANILQHPRGVTVDHKGRIIVVECKVMRVIIFDQSGNVLHKFGCSKHLEFPNGVVVNDKQEIFISDNRAHCVKVFNYEGQFLRQIGGEGVTNYPIGVGINANGDILIADNHNNFNLTIFTQDGQLINALESKVKHAQCFDVALMDDGSVVLASKDYRLYIYRYVQVPPIGM